MAERGRKSMREEIAVLRRYNDLSEPYFKFIQEMLNSELIEDRKWAAERLDKAYVKMVPQTIKGDEDSPLEFRVTAIKYIVPNGANADPDPQAAPSVGGTAESAS